MGGETSARPTSCFVATIRSSWAVATVAPWCGLRLPGQYRLQQERHHLPALGHLYAAGRVKPDVGLLAEHRPCAGAGGAAVGGLAVWCLDAGTVGDACLPGRALDGSDPLAPGGGRRDATQAGADFAGASGWRRRAGWWSSHE